MQSKSLIVLTESFIDGFLNGIDDLKSVLELLRSGSKINFEELEILLNGLDY